MKKPAVATLQGLPRCASRRGGRSGRGGFPGYFGWQRGARWLRRTASATTSSARARAGREQRRERGPGEEREGWTAPGGCVASPRMDRLEGEASSAKQEVAGVDARHASPLPTGRRLKTVATAVGWAAQCWTSTGAGPALVGCTGKLCSFYFFLFCFPFYFILPLFSNSK